MLNLWLANLAAYAVQIALLLAAGGLALKALRLSPGWRLLCWQALLASCIVLPLVQAWLPASGDGQVGITLRAVAVSAATSHQAGFHVSWAVALAGVLLAGTCLRLSVFGLGLIRLWTYRRRAQPHPQVARTLCARLGVRAEIYTSEEISGPATFGFLRPSILVPPLWLDNQAVLYHELIHVRRRDWLCMAGEELIRALLWFHPLVWWSIAQIQLAREEVVDREVIQLTQSREQYLETLLAIAAARSGLDLAPAPLFLRKKHLRNRVASLMKEVTMSRNHLQVSLAGFLAITLLAGWFAVHAFPLQAGQETSHSSARPIALEVNVGDNVVKVTVEIDSQGKVLKATANSGNNQERIKALDAVQQWKFSFAESGAVRVQTIDAEKNGVTLRAAAPQAASDAKRIKVDPNMQAANILKKVQPKYPVEAKKAGIQGVVQLLVSISAEGKVEDIQLQSGDPVLVESAVEAVRQWEYRPTLLNGEPVAVSTQITVHFTLAP